MNGPLALVGGDEFRPGCEELDRAMLAATGVERPVVLVLPTAAAHQMPEKAATNGVGYFSGLGADARAMMVTGSEHANDAALVSDLDGADVLYMTGGDPGHLVRTLESSLLLEAMQNAHKRGLALAGSSAGAMALAEWTRRRGWTRALGVAKGLAVLPHHEKAEPSKVAEELQRTAPAGTTVLGIDSRTGCLGGPTEWTVHGPGSATVYAKEGWRRFESGQSFTTGGGEAG